VDGVAVDNKLPLAQIPPLLIKLAETPPSGQPTQTPQAEVPMPENRIQPANGKPSTLTCPDCHGALWEIEDGDALTFRCRVGHAYSADAMFSSQEDSLERALWAATRSLEESAALSRKLARRAHDRKQSKAARQFEERADMNESHANVLRDVLRQGEKDIPREEGESVVPDARSA